MAYTIRSGEALPYLGEPIGYRTDAITGRTRATYRGGRSYVVDEPLCNGCDEPLELCECLAPVELQHDGRWAA